MIERKRNRGKKLLAGFLIAQSLFLPLSTVAASDYNYNQYNNSSATVEKEQMEYLNGAVYYNQAEEPYRDYPYGEGEFGRMINTGCGPAVMAMSASTILEEKITPQQMADLSIATGNIIPGNNGTLWQFFYDAGEELGLKVTPTESPEEVIEALKDGKLVINSVNSKLGGYWTYYGHFILLTGYQDGQIAVNDPAYRSKSGLHSQEQVFTPSKQMWIIEK